jgi:hypothetical protein
MQACVTGYALSYLTTSKPQLISWTVVGLYRVHFYFRDFFITSACILQKFYVVVHVSFEGHVQFAN